MGQQVGEPDLVVGIHASAESLARRWERFGQETLSHISEHLGACLPRNQSTDHGSATHPHYVADDGRAIMDTGKSLPTGWLPRKALSTNLASGTASRTVSICVWA
jgi:hypothetical protein